MSGLLRLELIDGVIIPAFGLLTAALVVLVGAVRPRHPVRLAAGAAIGAGVGVALVLVTDAWHTFDVTIPAQATLWVAVGLASAGFGTAAIRGAPWWRSALAAVLVVLSLVLGGLGVNREFGITHTLGALLGVQVEGHIALPAISHGTVTAPARPLYRTWTPPSGMPASGSVGALSGAERIPSPGYAPRDAAVYLPPAALVPNPPQLPLMVFMMGQPGTPDPTAIERTLDAFAAAHRGLAPIAIIADQLGAPALDPACHDSRAYGAVSTYFNQSIPAYARARLNIIDDPSAWVIAGYSNGGSCALLWGSEHPEIWGQVLDVSGNPFPGSGSVAATVANVFGGDTAAFEAAKPSAVMAAHVGDYAGHGAVFTVGAHDLRYGPGQRANAAAARAAGFTVVFAMVPGATHVGPALTGGLTRGIAALGTILGLSPPQP